MPVYKLIKNGEVFNTIVADEVESLRDQYDSIELVVEETNEPSITDVVKMISTDNIRANLTIEERVKWDNNLSPSVVTAKIEFAMPKTVEEATEVLNLLVASNVISEQSKDKILAV